MDNLALTIVPAILFVISEVLPFIQKIKSNGLFHLITNLISKPIVGVGEEQDPLIVPGEDTTTLGLLHVILQKVGKIESHLGFSLEEQSDSDYTVSFRIN
jgi:hypothetical protein